MLIKFEAMRAKEENAEEMGRLHAQSWQKAYRGIIPKEIIAAFTPAKRAQAFRHAIATRPEEYYIFQVDGHCAGLALLHKSHEDNAAPTEGEIYAIYFYPDFWGTEATDKAFRFCIGRLRELGFKQIHIWVLEENLRARRFYEKYGFAFDGSTQKIEIGKPLLEVRYTKQIG